jgi:hypothetical protein
MEGACFDNAQPIMSWYIYNRLGKSLQVQLRHFENNKHFLSWFQEPKGAPNSGWGKTNGAGKTQINLEEPGLCWWGGSWEEGEREEALL